MNTTETEAEEAPESLSLPANELPEGGVLDARYRVLRIIGRGGMCTVYEAEHLFTGQKVAIKMLKPSYRHTAEGRERLLREAQLLGELKHPNIVSVVDAGICEGFPYLALEKLEGRSLETLLAVRRTLDVGEALHVTRALASALSAAHRRNVIHRDLKPANVIIARDPSQRSEQVRLIDFGVAMAAHDETRPRLTAAGMMVGTPEYLAPEQLLGHPASTATDVYALGLVLFECLTGEVPFPGNFAQRLVQMSGSEARDVRELRRGISAEIAAVVAKALARDASRRYPSAEAFAHAISALPETLSEIGILRGVPPPLPAGHGRQHARAPFIAPIRAAVDGTVFEGRAEDISQGGMLALLQNQIPVGAHIALRFPSPISGKVIGALGLVRWTRKAERSRFAIAAGIEFLHLPSDAAVEIERYVKTISFGEPK